MGSTTDKIKGAANQAAGAVKQGVGEAVGNPNLEVEGAHKNSKAKRRYLLARPRFRSRSSSTKLN